MTTIVLDAKIPDSALAAETTELVRDWILNAVLADRTERRPAFRGWRRAHIGFVSFSVSVTAVSLKKWSTTHVASGEYLLAGVP